MSIDHILVPRAAIPQNRVLSFELFVKVADRYIKVANKDEAIDPERINRYLQHERDVLYIDRGSLERFMDERFGIMFEMIEKTPGPFENRFDWFIRCLELGFIDLKVVRPSSDKFMRIQLLVDWCYEVFRKRELRRPLLRKVYWSVEQIITRRALFGAMLTLTLVMEQNDCTIATFRSLFTAALFRDISLMYVDSQNDPHQEEVTDAFKSHPDEAIELLSKYITVDDIMRAVIGQHHELPRGNGFPRGIKRAETFQPAQYLNLADFVVTELAKYDGDDPLKHVQRIMPEENQKNLPLLLRVLGPIFSAQQTKT